MKVRELIGKLIAATDLEGDVKFTTDDGVPYDIEVSDDGENIVITVEV